MVSKSKQQFDEDLAVIFKNTNKNEKLAWARKNKKLQELIATMTPIQEKLMELLQQKQVILDEVIVLRKQMVRDCVHSPEFLIHHGDHVECKFCGVKLTINRAFI